MPPRRAGGAPEDGLASAATPAEPSSGGVALTRATVARGAGVGYRARPRMSLELLEVLFDAERHLDGRFWMDLCAHLAEEGWGLHYRDDGGDFTSTHGWRNVAEGHYPEPTTHGFMVCSNPAELHDARVQVNVYRVWDRHDEPWALPWDPESKLALDARRARLEVQLLRVHRESTEFGEELVRGAARALDGILDDEKNGSIILPDGSIEPYPDEPEERTPSVAELSMAGDEKTPTENTPADEDDDDPNVATLRYELDCREAFTPQHAFDELLRRVKSLAPYKGFTEIRATTDWELFGFADPQASGLTILFRRLDLPGKTPFKAELIFDLYKTFDPAPARIALIHKLAHQILETLLDHLDATATKAGP